MAVSSETVRTGLEVNSKEERDRREYVVVCPPFFRLAKRFTDPCELMGYKARRLMQGLHLIDEANSFKRDRLAQARIELKQDRTKDGRS